MPCSSIKVVRHTEGGSNAGRTVWSKRDDINQGGFAVNSPMADPILPIVVAIAGGGQIGAGTFFNTLGVGGDVVLRAQSPMDTGSALGLGMRANFSMLGELQGELSGGGELTLGSLPGIPTVQFGAAALLRGDAIAGDSYLGWANVAQGAAFQFRYYGLPLSGRPFSLDILGMVPLPDLVDWGVYLRANQSFQGNSATRLLVGVVWCPGGFKSTDPAR